MNAATFGEHINQTFTLELSFIEMHIIMKAMSEYSSQNYNPRYGTPNNEHAEAAEKLHDELTEIYSS